MVDGVSRQSFPSGYPVAGGDVSGKGTVKTPQDTAAAGDAGVQASPDPGGELSSKGSAKPPKDVTAPGAGSIQAHSGGLPPSDSSFKHRVGSSRADTFAPGGQVSSDLTQGLGNLQNGAAAFKAMLANVNDFDLLAKVMIQQFGQQRHEAVTDRMQMRQMAQQELLASAGQLRTEASDLMTGAVTSLVLGVVGGALSIAGGLSAGAGKVKGIDKAQEGETELGTIESHLSARGKGEYADAETSTLNVTPRPAPKISTRRETVISSDDGSPTTVNQGNTKQSKVQQEQDEKYSKMTTGELLKAKAEAKVTIRQGDKIAGTAEQYGQTMVAVSHLFEQVSGTASTMAQSQAKNDEAGGKVAEAAAEQLNTEADLKKAMIETLDDAMKQLIATVKDLMEAKAERMRSLTHI